MDKDMKIKVPTLATDGSNWPTYRDRLRWALDARDVLEHIDKDIDKPKDATDEKDAEATKAKQEKWRHNEAIVKQTIASTVPDTIFNRIKGKGTAKEIWDAIAVIFEGKSGIVAVELRQRLHRTRCKDGDDVRSHFDQMTDLRERLAGMGTSLTDDDFAAITISSLPSSYDPTIMTLITTSKLNKTPITPEVVTQLITDEFDRRVAKGLYGDGEEKGEGAFVL